MSETKKLYPSDIISGLRVRAQILRAGGDTAEAQFITNAANAFLRMLNLPDQKRRLMLKYVVGNGNDFIINNEINLEKIKDVLKNDNEFNVENPVAAANSVAKYLEAFANAGLLGPTVKNVKDDIAAVIKSANEVAQRVGSPYKLNDQGQIRTKDNKPVPAKEAQYVPRILLTARDTAKLLQKRALVFPKGGGIPAAFRKPSEKKKAEKRGNFFQFFTNPYSLSGNAHELGSYKYTIENCQIKRQSLFFPSAPLQPVNGSEIFKLLNQEEKDLGEDAKKVIEEFKQKAEESGCVLVKNDQGKFVSIKKGEQFFKKQQEETQRLAEAIAGYQQKIASDSGFNALDGFSKGLDRNLRLLQKRAADLIGAKGYQQKMDIDELNNYLQQTQSMMEKNLSNLSLFSSDMTPEQIADTILSRDRNPGSAETQDQVNDKRILTNVARIVRKMVLKDKGDVKRRRSKSRGRKRKSKTPSRKRKSKSRGRKRKPGRPKGSKNKRRSRSRSRR